MSPTSYDGPPTGAIDPTGDDPDGSIVVTHDEDRVGTAGGRSVLDRVVADIAGRVERELVAGRELVEFGPHRPDQGRELVRIPGGDRLEVEVHAVGTAIADGGGDLLRRD